MGIFDFFRKKDNKPEYDVTNITVADLQVGFIFEYDLVTWEVQEVYEYDWGDNFFSFEFKISDGTRTRYLSYMNDDKVFLSITEKIKIVIGKNSLNAEDLNLIQDQQLHLMLDFRILHG